MAATVAATAGRSSSAGWSGREESSLGHVSSLLSLSFLSGEQGRILRAKYLLKVREEDKSSVATPVKGDALLGL